MPYGSPLAVTWQLLGSYSADTCGSFGIENKNKKF
jgi:hypothetical protein